MGFEVEGLRFRIGFRVPGLAFGFQVSGFRFRVSGFRLRVAGLGFRVCVGGYPATHGTTK